MLFEMSIKAAGFVQSTKERAAEQENGLASIVNASPPCGLQKAGRTGGDEGEAGKD